MSRHRAEGPPDPTVPGSDPSAAEARVGVLDAAYAATLPPPLIVQPTDDGTSVRVLNPELLGGAGVLVVAPGVELADVAAFTPEPPAEGALTVDLPGAKVRPGGPVPFDREAAIAQTRRTVAEGGLTIDVAQLTSHPEQVSQAYLDTLPTITCQGCARPVHIDLTRAAVAQGLLLLDPGSMGDVRSLWLAIRGTGTPGTDLLGTAALRIALQGMVPRPLDPPLAEPGTWGVVTAGCVHHDERREWVHHPDGLWWPAPAYSDLHPIEGRDRYLPDDWADLTGPELVRGGDGDDD